MCFKSAVWILLGNNRDKRSASPARSTDSTACRASIRSSMGRRLVVVPSAFSVSSRASKGAESAKLLVDSAREGLLSKSQAVSAFKSCRSIAGAVPISNSTPINQARPRLTVTGLVSKYLRL